MSQKTLHYLTDGGVLVIRWSNERDRQVKGAGKQTKT